MAHGDLSRHPKKGRRLGAWLAFLDESGVTERPSIHRSWNRRGKTPIIRATGNTYRKRSISAVILCSPEGKKPRLLFRICRKNVDAEEAIRSVVQLKRHVRRPVILLWDGLPAHRSVRVRERIAQENDWLTMERLPAYAPDLNPVEYLWAAVKRKDLGNYTPQTIQDLDGKIRRAIKRMRRRPDILTGCLRASGLFVH